MYSTRGALALLWRGATTGPDGAQLWSEDEQRCAATLAERGICTVTVMTRSRDGKPEQYQVLHLSHEGQQLWEHVLDLVEARVLRDGE